MNNTDSGGLAVEHFVISSNANMYERLDLTPKHSSLNWKVFYYNICGFSIAFSMHTVGYFDLKSNVTV
jgi:hypothetical protein